MNIFSMDDPDYHKKGYFDAVFEKQSYLNIIYAILSFPFILLNFAFLITSFIVGFLLLPVWLGVPVLNMMFISANYLARTGTAFASFFLKDDLSRPGRLVINEYKQLRVFMYLIKSRQSWQSLWYFVARFFMGIVHFSLPILLIAMTALMLYTPFNAVFGHITLFGFTTDLFIEAVIVFFISIILLIGILNLINYWSGIIIKASHKIFKTKTAPPDS